ncbi:MAG TPA: hypothetical protein VIO32_10075 [Candidatus Baltobacteraceae bacterium]
MNTRKDFLLTTGLLALAPAAANAARKTPAKAAPRPELTFTFDRARFEQILGKPARHKQCFGATAIAGGGVMFSMKNSIGAYEDYLKEPAGSMQAVAVLYHGASISLAMSDSVWNGLFTPLFRNKPFLDQLPLPQRDDITQLALGKGNPFLRSMTNDPDDVSVERLVSKGSAFFVCHNAIAGFARVIADVVKEHPQKVHAAMMAGIVPGALAVPAGVMAINACQEAKFTYIQSSL